MPESQKVCRHRWITSPYFSRKDVLQRVLQFASQRLKLHRLLDLGGGAAVHFAVDAIEVALPGGAEVHPDRQAARTGRQHHINVAVIQEIARTSEYRAILRGQSRPGRLYHCLFHLARSSDLDDV